MVSILPPRRRSEVAVSVPCRPSPPRSTPSAPAYSLKAENSAIMAWNSGVPSVGSALGALQIKNMYCMVTTAKGSGAPEDAAARFGFDITSKPSSNPRQIKGKP
jgi:hypothetical protein